MNTKMYPIAMLFLGLSLATAATPSCADKISFKEIIASKQYLVEKLARSPVVIDAVLAQNAKKTSLDQIKKLDQEWINSKPDAPVKIEMQKTPVGELIKLQVQMKPDIFNEIFLTDNQGANVTAYPATSDYWQGDEEKFIKSYNGGSGVVFVSPATFDKSTYTYAIQISVPVIHETKTIGILIAGIRFSHFEDIKALDK